MIKTPEAPRILVTGGAGFLGTAIVTSLLASHPDWRITVVDIKPESDWDSPQASSVDYQQVDIRRSNECYNVVELTEPHVIIHTAGIVPNTRSRYGRNPVMQHNVTKLNVEGTANMLEAAKECGVRNFIYTSSCCVLTDDLEHDYPNFRENLQIPKRSLMYGESKASAEHLVLSAQSPDFSICILRPSVIIGGDDYQLIPSLHACIARNETPYQIGDGDNLYDFTYVDNVADAHTLAVENLLSAKPTASGQILNITNAQPITFRDFSLAVWAEFGHVPKRTFVVPTTLAGFIGLLFEARSWVTGTPPALCRGSVKDASGVRYANMTRAREVLGYTARVPIWEGVRRACEAYKTRLAEASKVQ